MKDFFTTKRICRAGIIAALYVALTCSFGAMDIPDFWKSAPRKRFAFCPFFTRKRYPRCLSGVCSAT